MSKQQPRPVDSEQIAAFLNYVEQAVKDHNYSADEVRHEEKLECDILHAIELECGYKQRCAKATELRNCLARRRISKDIVEATEPITAWAQNNKSAINALKIALGDTRKAERYHSSRRYRKRITGPHSGPKSNADI